MNRTQWLKLAMTALLAVGCGNPTDPGDTSGIRELENPLSVIASCPNNGVGCSFLSGALAIALADNDVAVISKHPLSGAILVNDIPSYSTGAKPALATATTVKTIAVTMAGTTKHTLVLDFANGTFAPGTATVPGITVAFATGGSDAFKLRGSATGADTITAGLAAGTTPAVGFNTDAYPDISFTANGSTVSYTFSLGGGNDVFAADAVSAVARLGASSTAFASAVTVYGGLGDDTFQGGLGNDVFFGDLGNDTFKGGPALVAASKSFYGGGGTDTADFSARTGNLVFTLDGIPAAGAVPATVGAVKDGEDTDGNGLADDTETDDIANDVEIIKGGTGNDKFYSDSTGTVGHTFYGGTGVDTVSYAATTAAVVVMMGDKKANDGPGNDNIGDDVENLICPVGAFSCTVTGNASDNTFFPNPASATADSFSGLTGVDTVSYAAATVTVNVTMDNAASTAPNGTKINTDIENFKCPTAAAASCTVTGNAASNHIWAGTGVGTTNVIHGGAGDDVIEAALVADTITCDDGSDLLVIPSGVAVVRVADCEL